METEDQALSYIYTLLYENGHLFVLLVTARLQKYPVLGELDTQSIN